MRFILIWQHLLYVLVLKMRFDRAEKLISRILDAVSGI